MSELFQRKQKLSLAIEGRRRSGHGSGHEANSSSDARGDTVVSKNLFCLFTSVFYFLFVLSPRIKYQRTTPRVQSRASTFVCTLKTPNTGSHHTCVLTHGNQVLHTLIGMGSAAFAAPVPCLGKATQMSGFPLHPPD